MTITKRLRHGAGNGDQEYERDLEMREAVKQRADIMWLQNDCIYNAFVRPSLTAEKIREIEEQLV